MPDLIVYYIENRMFGCGRAGMFVAIHREFPFKEDTTFQCKRVEASDLF